MDIILIAGLKNGRYICNFLNELPNVNLSAVFVMKDEYANKISDFVTFDDIVTTDKLIKVDRINDYEKYIAELSPDYIIVVGWSQLISEKIIKSAKKSCIGFHPAKLPKDRGRSVLAWQISDGYTQGCVTMFEIDVGVDTGKIIGQIEYDIKYEYTIKEVLDKTYATCLSLMENYFIPYTKGNILPYKQNEAEATNRRLRKYNDGIINWNKSSREIYNLIRAITIPYPVAVTFLNGAEIGIIEAFETEYDEKILYEPCGKIIAIQEDGIVVKTGESAVLITKMKVQGEILETNKVKSLVRLNDVFTMEEQR